MLLKEVSGIISSHRGQFTKGQHMNQILIGPCHKKGIYSMQLITGNPMVALVLLYVI